MLGCLLEKEFKQLLRNKFLPKFILLFPFVTLSIFPLVANFDIRNLSLAVVDLDHSTTSRRLIEKAVASGYFRLAESAATYSEALESIEADRADLILEIPAKFERQLLSEGSAPLLIAANTVNGTRGGLGSNYLSGIVLSFAAELAQERGIASPPKLEILPRYLYNPHLVYRVFMIPAIMVMMLTMLCGFLPALNIVSEKEKGTIEQLNVTPLKRSTFILSKLIPYWVVGFVALTVAMAAARLFHGLAPAGSVATLYLFAGIYLLAISGLGLVISNYARTVQQAMFMMFFFVLSLIFMSGLYTPVASMPYWAQRLSDISPLKYFILVMRQVYLKGSGPNELGAHLAALAGFALFFNGWAVLSYRKRG